MIVWRLNAQPQANRIRQRNIQRNQHIQHIEKFKSFGFKKEIIKNLSEVNFLDVLFKLRANTYCPHRQPDNTSSQMRTLSNHQSEHLNTLGTSVSQLHSRNSSSKQIFKWVKPKYEHYEESGSIHHIIKATKLIQQEYFKHKLHKVFIKKYFESKLWLQLKHDTNHQQS